MKTKQFDQRMIDTFDGMIKDKEVSWRLAQILPEVLVAGELAGNLTEEGARLIDSSGALEMGISFCPPEGDAGTGMVATNSVTPRTGNVSAGTSIFLMAVLEHALKKVHPEIDIVTTPAGDMVAMVHCNNCTGDIDAWVKVFAEFSAAAGLAIGKTELYRLLYTKALEADPDCGNLLSYNYISGESITGMEEGRPLLLRMPDSNFTLANFMRMNLYSALGTLKIGFDILEREEDVKLDKVYGHGGLFKIERVGQQMMATALGAPVTVMETAGEGGPWGMALLAAYLKNNSIRETLGEYLERNVFSKEQGVTIAPEQGDINGFDAFMVRYRAGLAIEKAAVDCLGQ